MAFGLVLGILGEDETEGHRRASDAIFVLTVCRIQSNKISVIEVEHINKHEYGDITV